MRAAAALRSIGLLALWGATGWWVWSLPTVGLPTPTTTTSWFEDTAPADGLLVLLRLAVLVLLGYLVAATVTTAAGGLADRRTIARWITPGVQRALGAVIGLGFSTMVALPAGAADAPADSRPPTSEPARDETTTIRRIGSDPEHSRSTKNGPTTTRPTAPAPTPPPSDTPSTAAPDGAVPDEPSEPTEPAATEDSPPAETWTVQAGDHFWSIAEETLADRTGRPPTTAEVAAYWQELIDANRSGLVNPADPDLIVPGQTLALPHPSNR